MTRNLVKPWNRNKDDIFHAVFDRFNHYLNPFYEEDNNDFVSRPITDISEDEKHYYISIELAGINKKDINISSNRNRITISAKKEESKKEDNRRYHLRESRSRFFEREIYLPNNINENTINAKYENGILDIAVDKAEPTQAGKKIEVK